MEARGRRVLVRSAARPLILPLGVTLGLVLGAAPPAAAQSDAQTDAQALVAAYNASGQDLFKRFSATPGNIAFSPFSIGTAMAMVLAGARGDTRREMARVLHQRLSPEQIDAANIGVLKTLNGYDKSAVEPSCPGGMPLNDNRCQSKPQANGQCPPQAVHAGEDCIAQPDIPRSAKLVVADGLMITRKESSLSKDYVSLLKDKYAAAVFQDAGLDEVNGWVAHKTNGKIDRILDDLGPDTTAVVLNAVYFKARWASVFSKDATRSEAFSLTPNQKISVPTMHRRGSYALVARPGYRAIRLPYEVPALGMIVVLPNTANGLARLGAKLTGPEFAKLTAAFKKPAASKFVDLALPRFKINYKADLVPPFKQAGMKLAFSPTRADFSGVTGRPPAKLPTAIGQIAHRAFIDVMETGTEAVAATAVTVTVTSAQRSPQQFHVDRPFLCYIVDDATGAILFQARVVDPR